MVQEGARAVDQVLLSGPDAERPGLVEEVAAAVGLPTELAPPLANVDANGLPAGENPYRHTIAAGLAMGAAA